VRLPHQATRLLAAAIAATAPFVTARGVEAPEIHAIAYHDVRASVDRDRDPDPYAVSATHLARHFEWLRQQGYVVVGLDEILTAQSTGRPLPDRAVLLTFDDGFRSMYTHVFPLLKVFGYRAVMSVVTSWIDAAAPVPYEDSTRPATDFLSWSQIREMQDSGLVEIASHTHALHVGVPANGFGNLEPAAVTRRYAATHYENDAEFMLRIEDDLQRSTDLIRAHTGRAPRVITWPYGAWNEVVRQTAARLGMTVSLALGTSHVARGESPLIGRELAIRNPDARDFAGMFAPAQPPAVMRAVSLDLDDIYDPDPAVQEIRLGRTLDTVRSLGVSHVFLKAVADANNDGHAEGAYFPNSSLPVRGDLFSRAALQLASRSDVRVFASLPLSGYAAAWSAGDVSAMRRAIVRLYEDLAIHADFHGLHFEEASSSTPVGDEFLNALSLEVTAAVRRQRPEILTSRPLRIDPRHRSQELPLTLDGFLNLYDFATLVAMPAPLASGTARQFCENIIPALQTRPGAVPRTIVMLADPAAVAQPDEAASDSLARLSACGVRNLIWQATALPQDPPAVAQLRRLMSAADTPRRP
jgi:biofilm PGA synthesis lipoprotein PgaB